MSASRKGPDGSSRGDGHVIAESRSVGQSGALRGAPTESRVLQAVATVERLDAPRRDDWTGEISRPWDLAEISSAGPMPQGSAPRRERRAPKPQRPRGRFEVILSLALSALLVACAVALIGDGALILSQRWSSDEPLQRWREIPVSITSEPSGAVVYVGTHRRGTTPLTNVEHCRGRVVRLRVKAAGHANWTWHGVCPARGPLKLHAPLKPLD